MPRPKTKTDADVISAIGRALLEHGPHRMTLAHAAEEAGISPATLIQRYGTKRDVILAWVRANVLAEADEWNSGVLNNETSQTAPPETGDPVAQLIEMLVRRVSFAENRLHLANSMMLLLEDIRDPEFRALAAEYERRSLAAIRQILQRAVDAGQIRTDPESFAETLRDASHGALISWGIAGQGTLRGFISGRILRLVDLVRA